MHTFMVCIIAALPTALGAALVAGYMRWTLIDSTKALKEALKTFELPPNAGPEESQRRLMFGFHQMKLRKITENNWGHMSLWGVGMILFPIYFSIPEGDGSKGIPPSVLITWAVSLVVGALLGYFVIGPAIKRNTYLL